MKALTLDATTCSAAVTTSTPTPVPGPDELLISVQAVALNPVDALYTGNPLGASGRVIGSDFAGTVATQGSAVPPSSPQVGDRVAGFVQGASSINELPGAFAEFVAVPADLVWRVPEALRLHDAAAMSLCALTAAQALFLRLGLPAPFETSTRGNEQPPAPVGRAGDERDTVFIYGASTSVGLYAAQLVRLAGEASGRSFRLVGAASTARHAMLSAAPYGYDDLVDYRDPTWPDQVRALTGGKGVTYIFDCIAEGKSVAQVAGTLAADGKLAVVRSRAGGAWEQQDVKVDAIYGAVWEGLGFEVEYEGFNIAVSPSVRQFTVDFYGYLSRARSDGRSPVEPNPVRLMPGGLEKIALDGFALLGTGSMGDRDRTRTEPWMAPVSAEKLVYDIGG